MKTLLLAGVATLSVLSASAAYADISLSPTHPLIGTWCYNADNKLYQRKSACEFDLRISRDGYGGDAGSCTFLEIKPVRNGIEAFSECTGDDAISGYEKAVFQIIGKQLKVRIISTREVKAIPVETGDTHKTMCVEIQQTPDGFLNIRQGPGTNFKVTGKLLPGESISVDFETDEWVHMKGMCNPSELLSGWVYKKYVKGFLTTKPEEPEPKCDIPGCDDNLPPYKIIPGATVILGLPPQPSRIIPRLPTIGNPNP